MQPLQHISTLYNCHVIHDLVVNGELHSRTQVDEKGRQSRPFFIILGHDNLSAGHDS
jgi:hypothetical protein